MQELNDLSQDEIKLLKLVPSDGRSIGQMFLRKRLRWSEKRFDSIKDLLIFKNILRPGKGRGGSLKRTGNEFGPNPSEYSVHENSATNGQPQNQPESFFTEEQDETWEIQGVNRLVEVLDYIHLREAIGDEFEKTLRAVRRRRELRDSASTKRELAYALVKIYGTDLFIGKVGRLLRDSLADSIRTRGGTIDNPGRFLQGRSSAIEFCKQTGFPSQFAGTALSDTRDDFDECDGHVSIPDLQEYQREVSEKIVAILNRQNTERKGLVCLPTGAGKTRVAVESIREWFKHVFVHKRSPAEANLVVWIAQTDELCEQALEEFKDVWTAKDHICKLRLVRLWRDFTASQEKRDSVLACIEDLVSPTLIFTTPQRLKNEITSNFGSCDSANIINEHIDLIVIDEAHHSAAPSYRFIVEHFESFKRDHDQEAPIVLGLTATPFRTSSLAEEGILELREIFGSNLIVPSKSIHSEKSWINGLFSSSTANDASQNLKEILQTRGVLAREKHEELKTSVILNYSDTQGSITFEKWAAEAIAGSQAQRARQNQISDKILEVIRKEPTASLLYFGPSVQDAEDVNAILLVSGARCAVLSGNTSPSRRRYVIEKFKEGELQVICNCEVLTTGFDAPRITHVVVGRPTSSAILYTQMIGRGLRGQKFGGTSECVIINVIDDLRGDGRPKLGFEDYMSQWKIKAS